MNLAKSWISSLALISAHWSKKMQTVHSDQDRLQVHWDFKAGKFWGIPDQFS